MDLCLQSDEIDTNLLLLVIRLISLLVNGLVDSCLCIWPQHSGINYSNSFLSAGNHPNLLSSWDALFANFRCSCLEQTIPM